MGNTKKKKTAGNVIKSKTFEKKKVKVGKVLKKTTATDSSFTTKKVVILSQFNATAAEPVSHRGLTLKDLNGQIGHPGFTFRRDAVIGLKQLLTDHPDLAVTHLFDVISSVGRLLTDENFATSKQAGGQLRALFRQLFEVSEKNMATPFHVLRSHLRISLSHIKLPIRCLGLDVLVLVFRRFPALARKNPDLKEAFLSLMRSAKRPTDRNQLADAISTFKSVYEAALEKMSAIQTVDVELNVRKGVAQVKSRTNAFDRFTFPVVYAEALTDREVVDTSFLDLLLK